MRIDRRADDPLAALKRYLATEDALRARRRRERGRRETMQQTFAEYGLAVPPVDDWSAPAAGQRVPAVGLVVAPLHAGFAWPAARLAFVTEAELYAGVVRRGRQAPGRRTNVDAMLRDLSEVRIGDPVVHEQHGIGRYLGLVTMDLGEGPAEFLQLAYANDAKLYVPVASLHLIGLLQRRRAGVGPAARARQRSAGSPPTNMFIPRRASMSLNISFPPPFQERAKILWPLNLSGNGFAD